MKDLSAHNKARLYVNKDNPERAALSKLVEELEWSVSINSFTNAQDDCIVIPSQHPLTTSLADKFRELSL